MEHKGNLVVQIGNELGLDLAFGGIVYLTLLRFGAFGGIFGLAQGCVQVGEVPGEDEEVTFSWHNRPGLS
jgi:hypothetical protein